mgnify:CR=1 FL=1
MNPYLDINWIDRTDQVEAAFNPTLEEIQNDPKFYAELINDLMFHWVYATRETPLMLMARKNMFENQK